MPRLTFTVEVDAKLTPQYDEYALARRVHREMERMSNNSRDDAGITLVRRTEVKKKKG